MRSDYGLGQEIRVGNKNEEMSLYITLAVTAVKQKPLNGSCPFRDEAKRVQTLLDHSWVNQPGNCKNCPLYLLTGHHQHKSVDSQPLMESWDVWTHSVRLLFPMELLPAKMRKSRRNVRQLTKTANPHTTLQRRATNRKPVTHTKTEPTGT